MLTFVLLSFPPYLFPSFNKITKITGLDKLIHLTDLSLTDNEISVIEGLDNLTKLNILSIGNNQIKDLSFIQGLRKFKHLRGLNLRIIQSARMMTITIRFLRI